MLDGNTEIMLERLTASTLESCQALCRLYEERAFEVLSVSCGDEDWAFVITMRVPKMLYVNYDADTVFRDGDVESISYQAGPYRGFEEAREAEREIIMGLGLDKVRNTYITGLRDHSRNFVGSSYV